MNWPDDCGTAVRPMGVFHGLVSLYGRSPSRQLAGAPGCGGVGAGGDGGAGGLGGGVGCSGGVGRGAGPAVGRGGGLGVELGVGCGWGRPGPVLDGWCGGDVVAGSGGDPVPSPVVSGAGLSGCSVSVDCSVAASVPVPVPVLVSAPVDSGWSPGLVSGLSAGGGASVPVADGADGGVGGSGLSRWARVVAGVGRAPAAGLVTGERGADRLGCESPDGVAPAGSAAESASLADPDAPAAEPAGPPPGGVVIGTGDGESPAVAVGAPRSSDAGCGSGRKTMTRLSTTRATPAMPSSGMRRFVRLRCTWVSGGSHAWTRANDAELGARAIRHRDGGRSDWPRGGATPAEQGSASGAGDKVPHGECAAATRSSERRPDG